MVKINKSDNHWEIVGDLTIVQAESLLAECNGLPNSESLVIDFAKVMHVDTASISLMFEWLRHAQANKCDLKFTNFPQNLLSLIALYGVSDLIPHATH